MTRRQRTRRHCWLTLACLAATSGGAAHALQVVEARDGQAVSANIAVQEPTRIRVEGAPITHVFGNVHSSTCAEAAPGQPAAGTVNPLGEIALECDRDKGEIYVKPVGPGAKPVNLFVSTEHATYTLVLRRIDMPADTIAIRDRQGKRAADGGAPRRAGGHVRAVKALLRALASGELPAEARVEEIGRDVPLWQEARFTLMRRVDAHDMSAEVYALTNVSELPMVLAEEEFDRDDPRLIGVAIEHHRLPPGEATTVYVIRAAE